MRVAPRWGAAGIFVQAAACEESATDAAGSSAGGSGAQVGSTGGAFGLGGGAGASSDESSDSDNGGSAYPSGPHGTQVGDVLANMNLLGYLRDATTGLASEAGLAPLSFASAGVCWRAS